MQDYINHLKEKFAASVVISKIDDYSYNITIERMYEYIKLGYAELKGFAQDFGTDSVDVNDYASSGGCDSCDWGSSYSLTIQVKAITRLPWR